MERSFHRTDRAVKERRILTNVLLSKVEEREQMLLTKNGKDFGKSDSVIFSFPSEPANATIAPKITEIECVYK